MHRCMQFVDPAAVFSPHQSNTGVGSQVYAPKRADGGGLLQPNVICRVIARLLHPQIFNRLANECSEENKNSFE